jgi:integrase
MSKKPKRKTPPQAPAPAEPVTLATVLSALDRPSRLSGTRLRDLKSAPKRVALLLGNEPAAIPLNMAAISARLAAVNPVAVGLTAKRFANIRSDFLAAVRASGVKPRKLEPKSPLSPDWIDLFECLSGRRAHIGLSRLARYASAQRIVPKDVNDEVIARFIAAVREGSLHRKPDALHRQVSLIWNEAVQNPALGLQSVTVPSFRGPIERIDWALLSDAFKKDMEDYLSWCGVSDPFAADARSRALSPRTLRLRRDQIHAAITALVKSGIEPANILSLADLTSPNNFKSILRWRLKRVDAEANTFNYNLGKALVQIAYEWVRVDAQGFSELKRLLGKMPIPLMGLTDKNKRFLRQFDDPNILRRLYRLPDRLWAEVRRDHRPNFRTLAKAQAALAIAILSYMPLRLQNLTALAFGTHLFMQEGAGAISTLELSAVEMKNRLELGFDIPPGVAKMLIEYRDRIAPKIIGHRPTRLFVTVSGTPKSQATVAYLIASCLRRRAGIILTPHQFRHLSAKVVLDAEPGAFETVRQHLAHKNTKTTTGFYAGISSRRAARHHHRLVQQALEMQTPVRGRRKRPSQMKDEKKDV